MSITPSNETSSRQQSWIGKEVKLPEFPSDILAIIASHIPTEQQTLKFLFTVSRKIRTKFPGILRGLNVKLVSRIASKLLNTSIADIFDPMIKILENNTYHQFPIKLTVNFRIKNFPLKMNTLFWKFPNIKTIRFNDFTKISEYSILHTHFPSSIQKLIMDHYPGKTTDTEIKHIFTRTIHLKKFIVLGRKSIQSLDSVPWPVTLEVLKVPQWVMADKEMQKIAQTCKNLRVMEVREFRFKYLSQNCDPKFPPLLESIKLHNQKEQAKLGHLLVNSAEDCVKYNKVCFLLAASYCEWLNRPEAQEYRKRGEAILPVCEISKIELPQPEVVNHVTLKFSAPVLQN